MRFRIMVPAGTRQTAHAALSLCALLLAGDASFSGQAFASDVATPEVRVLARREDLQADNPLNPYRVSPSSRPGTQTFTAEDIVALKPRDVFDLLGQAVGVLPLFQGRKVPFSLFIRGDSNFAFIVDGVYLTETTGARVLANLPVWAIEQVDVIRDSTVLTVAPLDNFAAASGAPNDGFIVIRTRRPNRSGAAARVSTESFDTTQLAARADAATDSAYASLTASRFSTDGREGTFTARDSDSLLLVAGGGGPRLRADATVYQDRTSQQIQAADPAVSALATQRWQFAPLDTLLGSARLSAAWSDAQITTLAVSRSEVDGRLLQGSTLLPIPNVLLNRETVDGVDLKHTVRFGGTLLRGGAQMLDWNTPTGQSFYEGTPRHERIGGWFLHGEQSMLGERVVVDGGYREDRREVVRGVDLFTAVPGLGGGRQLPVIRDRELPESRYGALGLTLRPWHPSLAFTARGYRAEQGALTAVATVPGVVLRPEEQEKLEAGVSWRDSAGRLAQLTWFRSEVLNAKMPVAYVRQGFQRIALYDQMDVVREGAELELRGQAGFAGGLLRAQFGWTHLIRTGGVLESGRTAPRNLGVLSAQYLRGDWDAGLALRRVDGFSSSFQSIGDVVRPIGDFVRLDVNFGRSFRAGGLDGRAGVFGRNLGDVRYQTQLGFPDPGRVLGIELMVEL